jgi:hypothetical protein
MSPPGIDVLTYGFISVDERHDFARAAAWDGDLGDFTCHLEDGTLEARPKGHYPDVEAAREALDPHLRAWALRAELEDGIRIEFRFRSAQGASGLRVMAETAVGIGEALDVTVGHGSYPPPSMKALATSPLVEDLLVWVRQLRERRQPMLVLAYLFLTRLEFDYNDRAETAAALNVSQPVLNTLGRLSEKNDPDERRKAKRGRPVERLTEADRQWLLAAYRGLLSRSPRSRLAVQRRRSSPWATCLRCRRQSTRPDPCHWLRLRAVAETAALGGAWLSP